ncbi:hypothetical protein [Stenotrophomonas sp. AS1]|uniref:hypothetical protein n=1 Tax=Stenotrophomonas sp. AS1 TaxID=3029188 RepID=UPI003B81C5FD
MSDRQTPESRLHALTDPHASIVEADGTVRPTDNRPIPGWQNHVGGATRGVKEYRGDQHAGVDNSVQAAQGCRLAAGVSDGADLCTLGTAEPTPANREIKGIAYGGSWHGEVLTSQLCRGRLMPRRRAKNGKVRIPSGGDVISQPVLSEFYDVEIAGYRDRLMPAGVLEGAYFFVLKGAETPSADQVMADARAAGLTFIRTYGGR